MNGSELTLQERNCNRFFMIAEFLWILAGRNDLGFLTAFNSNMSKFSDDGKTLYGAYGKNIGEQLQHCIDTLTKDVSSRQAVITFWRQCPKKSKDTPCTIGLHFMVRDGFLNCYSHMRSNDLWLGFPYDVFTFSMISKFVADNVGVKLGYLIHNADSLHLYDEHILVAQKALKETSKALTPKSSTLLSFKYTTNVNELQKELSEELSCVLTSFAGINSHLPVGLNHLIIVLKDHLESKRLK